MHTHTTASDGLLQPHELVKKAYQKRLNGISITDHDSVKGLDEAKETSTSYGDFLLIPGIEMGCNHKDEEVHILGYFIDYKDQNLIESLDQLSEARWNRGIEILGKLNEIGIILPIERILESSRSKGFIGRATIARELVKYKHVKTLKEAFDKYLDLGKPAYVDRYKLSMDETIQLIHQSGGISILAHPGLLIDKQVMTECVQRGIMGIECRHTKHTKTQEKSFTLFAKDNNLIVTGGSDYHGEVDILGDFATDVWSIPEFRERL